MAYFKDLTRYGYSQRPFHVRRGGELYNVGWLERCAPYPTGAVAPELVDKLLALCKFPVNQFLGSHGCDFCREDRVRIADSEGEFYLGNGEIRVPAADGTLTYVAPSLIYHYVVAHHYRPPDVFLDALGAFLLPNAAAVWILEKIDGFQNDPAILTHLLDRILQRDKPRLPPGLRDAVLKAANELKVTTSLRSDERETAEKIIHRLKSLLTKS
jgi:hypothetical protein